MRSVIMASGIAAAGMLGFGAAAFAGAELVAYPEGYRDSFTHYSTVNRADDRKQVVKIFANDIAIGSVGNGAPLDSGAVIAMEVYKAELDASEQPVMGDDGFFVPAELAAVAVMESRDGFGADYTFEATGNVVVMRQAVEAARMGWGLCTVAGVAGKGETLDVIPRFLITGRRIAGSSFGGVKGRDGVPKLIELYLEGKIDVDPFISHRITLDEVNRGFELMEAQDGIRSVIEFN